MSHGNEKLAVQTIFRLWSSGIWAACQCSHLLEKVKGVLVFKLEQCIETVERIQYKSYNGWDLFSQKDLFAKHVHQRNNIIET